MRVARCQAAAADGEEDVLEWPHFAIGVLWQFEYILLEFFTMKRLHDSLINPVIQR